MSRRIQPEHYERDRKQLGAIVRYELRQIAIANGKVGFEIGQPPIKLEWSRVTPPIKAAYASVALIKPGKGLYEFMLPVFGDEFWVLRAHKLGFMQSIMKPLAARLSRKNITPSFWLCMCFRQVEIQRRRAPRPAVFGCIALSEPEVEKFHEVLRSFVMALHVRAFSSRHMVVPINKLLTFVAKATSASEDAERLLGSSAFACVREVNQRAATIYGRSDFGEGFVRELLRART